MIFNQWIYFIILSIAVTSFFAVPKPFRSWVLLISGIIFYGYFAKIYLLLISLLVVIVHCIISPKSKARTVLALISVVSTLIFFKYRNFLTPAPQIVLPLAISFFTFEIIHVIIDKHQKKISHISLLEFATFIFFFPTLVAGPIKRFSDFTPQIAAARLIPNNIYIGIVRILIGLVKKMVIADTLAVFTGQTFTSIASVTQATIPELWLALGCYSLRIYADFSGYSDIAIGSAKLFGITIPENFIFPYLRTNIASFWQHWHRTLYTWIVDYVYIPLGGSRHGLMLTLRNILIAMAISGLWHGAAGHFVLWGLYHGLLLALYRVYKHHVPQQKIFPSSIATIASTGITFILVSVGWLLFIAPVSVAYAAARKMIGIPI